MGYNYDESDDANIATKGYNGNPRIKGAGVQIEWTQEMLDEYLKCAADVNYFCETYCKIMSIDEGEILFKLRKYQKRLFKHINKHNKSIVLAPRQCGKSTTTAAWLLWFVIFHPDKNCAILANKGSVAREILSRVYNMLEGLPFFLQPGVKFMNKGSVKFCNKSAIKAASTSSSSIRGETMNVIILDEFSHVHNAEEFYTSTYPVIASGKDAKVIIISTANGVGNLYYKLWINAVNGKGYKPFTIKWNDVPGRTEAWRKKQIEEFGEARFDQEFNNKFLGSSNTLIASSTLLELTSLKPMKNSEHGLNVYSDPVDGHRYVLLVDVAKGRGKDYSTINIIDTTSKPFNQVATYRSNEISPLLLPDIIVRLGLKYNKAWVVIESNDAGLLVAKSVYYDLEYENMFVESFKGSKLGVCMTSKVKRIGCSNLKDLIENNTLTINDLETISELTTFEAKGDSWAASVGCHDDLVMNLVLFAYFVGTPAFADETNMSLRELVWNVKQLEERNDEPPPPVGFFDTNYDPANIAMLW